MTQNDNPSPEFLKDTLDVFQTSKDVRDVVVLDLDSLSRNLLPRNYQKELLLGVKDSNSILVLQAGAGKTLLAAMLIEFFSLNRSVSTSDLGTSHALPLESKVIIFLCNTNVLADQQASFIKNFTFRTVKHHKSSQKIAKHTLHEWSINWKSAEVHTMTGQLLLNCLRSGFIKMGNISLLIFDECHHMRKNSSYSRIMREFYDFTPKEHRPQLFGMTASPTNANESVMKSLNRIEAVADSSLVTKDISSEYSNSSMLEYTYLTYCIEYELSPSSLRELVFTKLDLVFQSSSIGGMCKAQKSIDYIIQELGLYLAESSICYVLIYLNNLIATRSAQCANQNVARTFITNASGISNDEACEIKSVIEQISNLSMWISNNQKIKAAFNKQNSHLSNFYLYNTKLNPSAKTNTDLPIPKKIKWQSIKDKLSPKVNKLVEYIYNLDSKSTTNNSQSHDQSKKLSIIVFVNRRITAFALSMLFNDLEETNFLKSEPFTSISSTEDIVLSSLCFGTYLTSRVGHTAQMAAMERFRSGETNMLISTQVAEEGLDIPACSIIVRFDPPPTLTSFIQSRGRARNMSSEYVMMVALNYQGDRKYLCKLDKGEFYNASFLFDNYAPENAFDCLSYQLDGASHRTFEFYNKIVLMEQLMNDMIKLRNNSPADSNPDPTAEKMYIEKLTYRLEGTGLNLDGISFEKDIMKIESRINVDADTKIKLNNIRIELLHGLKSQSLDQLYFEITKTGAKITSQSSTQLVNNYIQSLPSDQVGRTSAVCCSEMISPLKYVSNISFPSACPIKKIYGPTCIGPKVAKKAASFYASIVLYLFNTLDDYLTPIQIKSSIAANPPENEPNNAYKNFHDVLKGKNALKKFQPTPQCGDSEDELYSSDFNQAKTGNAWKNGPVEFLQFNSLFLSSPEFGSLHHNNSDCSGSGSFVGVYVYSVNLSYQMYNKTRLFLSTNASDQIYSSNATDQTKMDNDSLTNGLQVLFLTRKPLPDRLLVPLYTQNDLLPLFYKFDPICIADKGASQNNGFEAGGSYNQADSAKELKLPLNANYNKIRLHSRLWKLSVSFTSGLLSLLGKKKFTLSASEAKYAFALPTESLSRALTKCYNKCDIQAFTDSLICAQKVHSAVKSFCNGPEDFPIATVDDFDFAKMENFFSTPNMLANYGPESWAGILGTQAFISDIGLYQLKSYRGFLPNCTADSKLIDIINAVYDLSNEINKGKISRAKKDTENGQYLPSDSLDDESEHLGTFCASMSNYKGFLVGNLKDIRLIDVLLQEFSLYPDQCYKETASFPLVLVSKLVPRFNMLVNTIICDVADPNDKKHGPKEFNPGKNKKLLQSVACSTDVELKERAENNALKYIISHLKHILAIPNMINILPWSHEEIQQLSVLPSLLFRLDYTLSQIEMASQLGLTFFLNTERCYNINVISQSNERKCQVYANPDTMTEYLGSNLTQETSNPSSKESIVVSALSQFKRCTQKYVNNFTNYILLPSWLLRTAMTGSVSCEDVNYQRLEILGDSVLRVIVATQLFAGLVPHSAHEGILTSSASALVSNVHLSKLSQISGIYKGIHNIKLTKKQWSPPGAGWMSSIIKLPKFLSCHKTPWYYDQYSTGSSFDSNGHKMSSIFDSSSKEDPGFVRSFSRSSITQLALETGLDDLLLGSYQQLGSQSKASKVDDIHGIYNLVSPPQSLVGRIYSTAQTQNDFKSPRSTCNLPKPGFLLKERCHYCKTNAYVSNHQQLTQSGFSKKCYHQAFGGYSKHLQPTTSENGKNYIKLKPGSTDTEPYLNRRRFVCMRSPKPIFKFLKSLTKSLKHIPSDKAYQRAYRSKTPTLQAIKLSTKTQADVIESLFGASFILGGIASSFKFAKTIGLVNAEWSCWDDMYGSYLELSRGYIGPNFISMNEILSDHKPTIDSVEAILGYKFANPLLLIEALTHPTSINSIVPSYQRLEFLGDSIISVLVTRHYYDVIDYPEPLNPYQITLLKHVAVSNDVLGIISTLHNLVSFLRFESQALSDTISFFVGQVNKTLEAWKGAKPMTLDDECSYRTFTPGNLNNFEGQNNHNRTSEKIEPWLDVPPGLWELVDSPPKVLGDLLESIIGAIYTDSGFSLDMAQSVFSRLIEPFIGRFIGPTQVSVNPINHLVFNFASIGCNGYQYQSAQVSVGFKNEYLNKLVVPLVMIDYIANNFEHRFLKKQFIVDSGINKLNFNDKSINQSVMNKSKNQLKQILLIQLMALTDGGGTSMSHIIEYDNLNVSELAQSYSNLFINIILCHEMEVLGFAIGPKLKTTMTQSCVNTLACWNDSGSLQTKARAMQACFCTTKREPVSAESRH